MRLLLKVALTTFVLFSFTFSYAFTLENTYWDKVGKKENISPYLLYAIAIKETMMRVKGTNGKFITPSLWAMNSPSTKGRHYDTQKDLIKNIKKLRAKGITNIDIGVMQINFKWHKHRVQDTYDLTDPSINIQTGAIILKEALGSTEDIIRGVGRYHNPGKKRSFKYGYHVLEIYLRLVNYADVYHSDIAFGAESPTNIDAVLRAANKRRPHITNLIISQVDGIERDLREALANLKVAKKAVKIAVDNVNVANRELKVAKTNKTAAEGKVSDVAKRKKDYLLANTDKKTPKSIAELAEVERLILVKKEAELAKTEQEIEAKQKEEIARIEKENILRKKALLALLEKETKEKKDTLLLLAEKEKKARKAAFLAKLEKESELRESARLLKIEELKKAALLVKIEKETADYAKMLVAKEKALKEAEVTRLAHEQNLRDIKLARVKTNVSKKSSATTGTFAPPVKYMSHAVLGKAAKPTIKTISKETPEANSKIIALKALLKKRREKNVRLQKKINNKKNLQASNDKKNNSISNSLSSSINIISKQLIKDRKLNAENVN